MTPISSKARRPFTQALPRNQRKVGVGVTLCIAALGSLAGPIALFALPGLSGCRTGTAVGGATPGAAAPVTAAPQPGARPTTAQSCRACNGIWAVHGIAGVESCNCRTHDGGKRCRDGADCEGACVTAEQPEREIVNPGPPPRGYFVGRCSDLATVFGCSRFIDRGASAAGPGSLAEPPAMMCVD